MKIGILKNWDNLYMNYVNACKELKIDYEIIDFLDTNWIEQITNSNVDGFVYEAPSDIEERKKIFDERLYILKFILNKKIFPSYLENSLYENKRNMAYFLQLNNYPHPETYIFSKRKDVLKFLKKTEFPIVFKSNFGASASGVKIIKKSIYSKYMTCKVFGCFNKFLVFGKIYFLKYKGLYLPNITNTQKHYIIVQKFHAIKWEWRIIKIGNVYAAHKKLLKGEFASGSNMVSWDKPSQELLYFIKNISDKHNFNSMAFDIFETKDGNFLINELQTFFGSYLPYQMKINNVPGIYKYENGKFKFYKGEFHQNRSNNLRIQYFVKHLSDNQ